MPYIKRGKRENLDHSIAALVSHASASGDYAYIYFRLLANSAHALAPKSFAGFAAAMGILEAAKAEFYRRVVVPYEEERMKENGDV